MWQWSNCHSSGTSCLQRAKPWSQWYYNLLFTLSHISVETVQLGFMFTERGLGIVLEDLVPIRLTNVVCAGNETSLSECSFDGVNGDPTCTHADDVIVGCLCKFA